MRRTQVVALAAAMLAALAGCGGGAPSSGLDLPEYRGTSGADATGGRSADDLLAGARTAVAEAESVSLSGTTTTADGTLAVDLAFVGPDGSGTYSVGAGTITLLVVDGRTLYRGDAQVYAQMYAADPPAFERRLAGRWIVAGSTDPRLMPVEVIASRDEALADVLDPGEGRLTAGEATVDGATVVALTGDSTTTYLDPTTLRPLRVVPTAAGAADSGAGISFTYDPVTRPTAPPADEVVDLGDL